MWGTLENPIELLQDFMKVGIVKNAKSMKPGQTSGFIVIAIKSEDRQKCSYKALSQIFKWHLYFPLLLCHCRDYIEENEGISRMLLLFQNLCVSLYGRINMNSISPNPICHYFKPFPQQVTTQYLRQFGLIITRVKLRIKYFSCGNNLPQLKLWKTVVNTQCMYSSKQICSQLCTVVSCPASCSALVVHPILVCLANHHNM